MKLILDDYSIIELCKGAAVWLDNETRRDAVTFVPILDGAFRFFGDLVGQFRQSKLRTAHVAFARAQGYVGTDPSSTMRVWGLDQSTPSIRERTCVIIEDIVDTGRTVATFKQKLLDLGAERVLIVSLLDKRFRRKYNVAPDYACYRLTGEEFVIGYGLDLDGQHRLLPGVYAL